MDQITFGRIKTLYIWL